MQFPEMLFQVGGEGNAVYLFIIAAVQEDGQVIDGQLAEYLLFIRILYALYALYVLGG